jgi:hypothetical protein
MKFGPIIFVFLFCSAAFAQQQAPNRTATTQGSCSPANAGNITTFNFTCSGLTPAQQKILESVPDLLNKLLALQTDSSSEILSKLNACIVQSAPRSVSPEQKQKMVAALGGLSGMPTVLVRATNSTSESSHYASQLQEAFASIPGWKAPPVFENMVAGIKVPVGLVAYVRGDRNIYGIAIQQVFKQLDIDIQFGIDSTLSAETVIMVVGQKPIE